ncbi:MAG: LCP family protein, partial [Armatimonadota bacterium]
MTQNIELQTPPVTTRKRMSNTKRIVRLLLIMLMAAAVIGGGMFIYCYSTSYTIRDTIGAIVTQSDKPENAFPGQNQINVLLMGRDLDRDNHGQIMKTRGRTDCMMLAHVDFKNQSLNILSIPRDTLVRIPGYRGKRRISYAHQYGGPDLAVETIQNFLGVTPDYYMMVNFDGFARTIDKIGGLEVVVDKKLEYDDNWGNLHIHLEPGKQVINGEQAMGFARYRKSNDGKGDSDLVRIERQQRLLSAMKSKLCKPGVVM